MSWYESPRLRIIVVLASILMSYYDWSLQTYPDPIVHHMGCESQFATHTVTLLYTGFPVGSWISFCGRRAWPLTLSNAMSGFDQELPETSLRYRLHVSGSTNCRCLRPRAHRRTWTTLNERNHDGSSPRRTIVVHRHDLLNCLVVHSWHS